MAGLVHSIEEQVGKRAFFAQGRTVRHADQRSQLHKGLIVVAGRIRRLVLHHAGGERFFHCWFRDGSGVVVQTGEHPQHIAVHGGHRDAEADGRNGSRRVVPDAGQGPQGIIVGGQLSAVLLADDAGVGAAVYHVCGAYRIRLESGTERMVCAGAAPVQRQAGREGAA